MLNGLWYNTMMCSRFYGLVLEDYFKTAKCEKFNIMCSIDSVKKNRNESTRPNLIIMIQLVMGLYHSHIIQQKNHKIIFLTLNFIDGWLISFKINYKKRTYIFCEETIELFQKIPVALPKPVDHINKLQFFLQI